jgi:2'-hydroxyisoflavone reductase
MIPAGVSVNGKPSAKGLDQLGPLLKIPYDLSPGWLRIRWNRLSPSRFVRGTWQARRRANHFVEGRKPVAGAVSYQPHGGHPVNRRRLIQWATAASGIYLLRGARAFADVRAASRKTILVLGGTSFLGPAVVRAAVIGGHEVTLFNRGITNPELFPFLEKLRGLRSPAASEENWTAIGSRRWDAIIDVWPSDPALAESAAKRLRDRTDHYVYVSSIATYDPRGFARPNLTEDAALNPWDSSVQPYSRGKSESERRLHALVGQKLTVVRPGAIKGDRDDTPDLLAWLRRSQSGGRHIGPGSGDDHVQIVDVKDVAEFLILALERPLYGAFNLTGSAVTFREFVDSCSAVVRSRAEYVWIPRDYLHEQGLDPAPFNDPKIPSYLGKFPYWHPESERVGFYQIRSQKALDSGWSQRPFAETAEDYLWSIDAAGSDREWTDELGPDIEARVLEKWLRRG